MQSQTTQDEFAAKWTSAQPMVAAYIASVVRDFHETEDLLQKVAVIAFQKRDDYDPERPFYAWVCGIARFELMRWRRDKARDRHVFTEETISRLASAQSLVYHELDDRREALHMCYGKLDGRAKRFIEMRYLQDLMPTQIANRMGMKATAVRVSLHRVRQVLERCIQRRIAAKGVGRG